MSRSRAQRGFSLIEVLVSLAILAVSLMLLAGLLIENSKINSANHARAQVQSNARTALSVVTQKLRQAGWSPSGTNLTGVVLDADPTDAISYVDLFVDLNADGDTSDTGESIRIRHIDNRIEWRETSSAPYQIVAVDITNDADGDGILEQMFVPNAFTDPMQMTVTVTAASTVLDPNSGQPVRETLSSLVFVRN